MKMKNVTTKIDNFRNFLHPCYIKTYPWCNKLSFKYRNKILLQIYDVSAWDEIKVENRDRT
jgi:hypothetical protein